jgi:hypothetical protein
MLPTTPNWGKNGALNAVLDLRGSRRAVVESSRQGIVFIGDADFCALNRYNLEYF